MWQRKLFLLFPLSQVIWVCSWNPASKVRITNWQNIINIPVYEIKGFSFCKSLAFDKYCIHPISNLNMTTMIIMYSLRFLCFISESPVCPIAISDLIATMYYMHAQIQDNMRINCWNLNCSYISFCHSAWKNPLKPFLY